MKRPFLVKLIFCTRFRCAQKNEINIAACHVRHTSRPPPSRTIPEHYVLYVLITYFQMDEHFFLYLLTSDLQSDPDGVTFTSAGSQYYLCTKSNMDSGNFVLHFLGLFSTLHAPNRGTCACRANASRLVTEQVAADIVTASVRICDRLSSNRLTLA